MRAFAFAVVAVIQCNSQPTETPAPAQPPPRAQPAKPTPRPGPVDPIVDVASQSFHSCAMRKAGSVSCWGRNVYGELGDGTRTNSQQRVAVVGLADAKQVVTGRDFGCALRKGGSVVCWGNNENGQLGDGRGAKVGARSPRPVKVAKLNKVTQLVAGDWHVCALVQGGAVRCWGNGENGQIGTDAARAFATPQPISQLGPVRQLASGSNHLCAVQKDGRVKCWGRNTEGQLGDGKSGSRIKPVFVSGINGAKAVWSGHTFSCATLENGSNRCWGDNKKGQLGPKGGRDLKWNAPIPLDGVKGAVQIVGGQDHACARLSTGRVTCWGSNEDGRALGKGRGVISKPTPVRGVSDAVAIAAGLGHTCAVRRSGDVVCWGTPSDAALGPQRLASNRVFRYDGSHANPPAAALAGTWSL